LWCCPFCCILETSVPGLKCPGHETDCLPPSVIQVMNAWNCTYVPPYVRIKWCSITHRDTVALLFTFHSFIGMSYFCVKPLNENNWRSDELWVASVGWMESCEQYWWYEECPLLECCSMQVLLKPTFRRNMVDRVRERGAP
jgi:hypothetical protein